MRNRISSFLCRFLLVLTLFLPSQTALATRTLAYYYPEGVTGGGEPEGGYSSPNYEKEQSKGLMDRSHSMNSGSAGESPTTSSTVDGTSSPTSVASPAGYGSQGLDQNDPIPAATTTTTNNFAPPPPPPSGGYPAGYYYSGRQQNVYRSESRSATTTMTQRSNSNGFANYESRTARSAVMYGPPSYSSTTRVTTIGANDGDSPPYCDCEEEANP